MVTRMRHDVVLYVHCFTCIYNFRPISMQSGPEDVLKNVLNDYGFCGDRRGKAPAYWYYGRQ